MRFVYLKCIQDLLEGLNAALFVLFYALTLLRGTNHGLFDGAFFVDANKECWSAGWAFRLILGEILVDPSNEFRPVGWFRRLGFLSLHWFEQNYMNNFITLN